jgi:hypothetical protein
VCCLAGGSWLRLPRLGVSRCGVFTETHRAGSQTPRGLRGHNKLSLADDLNFGDYRLEVWEERDGANATGLRYNPVEKVVDRMASKGICLGGPATFS